MANSLSIQKNITNEKHDNNKAIQFIIRLLIFISKNNIIECGFIAMLGLGCSNSLLASYDILLYNRFFKTIFSLTLMTCCLMDMCKSEGFE